MKLMDFTKSEKPYNFSLNTRRRFNLNGRRCSMCGGYILDTSDVLTVRTRIGRYVSYSFYHSNCVHNDYSYAKIFTERIIENGKKETKKESIAR